MHVTQHHEITEPKLVSALWKLYEAGHSTLTGQVPSRVVLYRHEFEDELRASGVRIWVVWDDELPVALSVVDTDLAENRWVSPAYLSTVYADAWSAGRVHYICLLVVHPDYQGSGAFGLLVQRGFELEAAEGATLVFDVPSVNQPTAESGLAQTALRFALQSGGARLEEIEVQRFFALTFGAPADRGEPRELDHGVGMRRREIAG